VSLPTVSEEGVKFYFWFPQWDGRPKHGRAACEIGVAGKNMAEPEEKEKL